MEEHFPRLATHQDSGIKIMQEQISHIDKVCSKGEPIRLGMPHEYPVLCKKLDEKRVDFLNQGWNNDSHLKSELHKGLIGFGGEFSLLRDEEDLVKILTRGQLWGKTGMTLKGAPIQCHMNSCLAWEANQDRLYLATGYALSADGLWRQHSWCMNPKPRSIQVVETTEPRLLYFGFVMTLEETIQFADMNTDFGVDVDSATYARYGLTAPNQSEIMRAV